MRNLLVSAFVIGTLTCPVAFAHEAEALVAPATTVEHTETTEVSKTSSKPLRKRAKVKKKVRKCHDKHHHKQGAAKRGHKTPAEEKIAEETEKTNR